MIGAVLFDRGAERIAVEHREDLIFVGDLHRRRTGIAVARDDMAAEAFRRNDELAAELARAEEKDLCGGGHMALRCPSEHRLPLVSAP